MTFHRSQDFRNLSVAKLSQIRPSLGTRFHQKMTGSRHPAVVDEVSVVKLSQLHPLLRTGFHQKMTGLQHLAVVDEVSVAREGVGEVDIAEKEVDEDMAEGALTEIAVVVVVSSPLERSLIWRLT